MKECLFIILLSGCLTWMGCNGKKSVYTQPDEPARVMTLSLPVAFEGDTIPDEDMFAYPVANRDSVFTDLSLFGEDIRIARLPQRGDIEPVLIYTEDPATGVLIEVYTLGGDNKIKDHLTVYSTEKLKGDSVIIRQTFAITDDYRFKVSKKLQGILIEQLFYKIDNAGQFVEIRDGETPAIAYDSFDGITYMVESFIWDYNDQGGLYRTNSKVSTYQLTPDGKFVTEPQ